MGCHFFYFFGEKLPARVAKVLVVASSRLLFGTLILVLETMLLWFVAVSCFFPSYAKQKILKEPATEHSSAANKQLFLHQHQVRMI